MIKSNLRDLLQKNPERWSEEQANIRAGWSMLTAGQEMRLDQFITFAQVLEQNVVPASFRNEVLPILLDGARTGHYLDAAADARDRALVRTVLDYDWSDTDAVEALDPPTLWPERAPGEMTIGVDHASGADYSRTVVLAGGRWGIEHIIVSDVVDKAQMLNLGAAMSDYAEPDNSQAGIERGNIVRMLEREGLRAAADLVRSCAHHREPT